MNTGMLPLRDMINANKDPLRLTDSRSKCAFVALPCSFEHSETQYWLAHSVAHLYDDDGGGGGGGGGGTGKKIGLVPFSVTMYMISIGVRSMILDMKIWDALCTVL